MTPISVQFSLPELEYEGSGVVIAAHMAPTGEWWALVVAEDGGWYDVPVKNLKTHTIDLVHLFK